jgi:hypothetical protein
MKIALFIISLMFVKNTFAANYECTISGEGKSASIDTAIDEDTHGSISILFKDGSELTAPILNFQGNDDSFSASGRIRGQVVRASVRKTECKLEGDTFNYQLSLSRNGEPLNGCCN